MLEHRFDSPTDTTQPSEWHNLTLHFANVMVETIKLVMFMCSIACDVVKPFVGTR